MPLLALLGRDDLRVESEKLVWWAVAGWIAWDGAERTKHLCQLMGAHRHMVRKHTCLPLSTGAAHADAAATQKLLATC